MSGKPLTYVQILYVRQNCLKLAFDGRWLVLGVNLLFKSQSLQPGTLPLVQIRYYNLV